MRVSNPLSSIARSCAVNTFARRYRPTFSIRQTVLSPASGRAKSIPSIYLRLKSRWFPPDRLGTRLTEQGFAYQILLAFMVSFWKVQKKYYTYNRKDSCFLIIKEARGECKRPARDQVGWGYTAEWNALSKGCRPLSGRVSPRQGGGEKKEKIWNQW